MIETAAYPILASALGVAFVGAYVYLGVAETRRFVIGRFSNTSELTRHIPLEVGHDIRRQLRFLEQQYGAYLGSFLVFLILLAAVLFSRPTPLPLDIPPWSWVMLTTLVGFISMYLPVQALRLHRARARLAYARDAHVVIGHALQRVAIKGNHIFHNVRLGAHTIDSVIVGANGVYVVSVLTRQRPEKSSDVVRVDGADVYYADHRDPRALREPSLGITLLAEELGKVIGGDVKVRSVIAAPGWNVGPSGGSDHLLVNEKTLVTLTGWTCADAYLMNEDADKICQHLSRLCSADRSV